MAELFLQEFNPLFISRPTTDELGYDLLVGFSNKRGGINTFAVEVKGTERPPGPRFQILRRTFERIAHSNLPGLLLVADVKQNTLYYGWLRSKKASGGAPSVAVPLVEINDATKKDLKAKFEQADIHVAAAG
jgi:hypothetical protein